MIKLGFNENWINLIMQRVKTVYFFFLINGEPKCMIYPTREIRQGDLLSPYLFLLCTEGLIFLLSHAADANHILGIQICRRAPKINHLLFEYDSILFCKAELEENKRIQTLLNVY